MRALLAIVAFCAATAVQAQTIEVARDGAVARFEGPTDRYGHAIMGNLPEWSRLCLAEGGREACVTLPENAVFEDIAPRLADMDGNGTQDAVVVESTTAGGAALVVYRLQDGALVRTSTPSIGRRNRWLSPAGIADFDGDGRMDVAYVETPHLGKVLKIVSWDQGVLRLTVTVSGLSNHRIGDETITSGLRDCGRGPEIIIPDGNWSRVYSGRFSGGTLAFEEIGRFQGIDAFADYLTC